MGLNKTEELIKDIKKGKMVLLMDDEDRENEGDLVISEVVSKVRDIGKIKIITSTK